MLDLNFLLKGLYYLDYFVLHSLHWNSEKLVLRFLQQLHFLLMVYHILGIFVLNFPLITDMLQIVYCSFVIFVLHFLQKFDFLLVGFCKLVSLVQNFLRMVL